jgi:hypothetical protein
MTTEQIIKALKVCTNGQSCKKCPYEDGILCIDSLLQEALLLIKEQQAEIERLKANDPRTDN